MPDISATHSLSARWHQAGSAFGPRLEVRPSPFTLTSRMMGVTPPHIYELTPREALFHGVPALRLYSVGGEDKIFGRTGLLAHTYMLGARGDSNGCVSFKDYYAFLEHVPEQGHQAACGVGQGGVTISFCRPCNYARCAIQHLEIATVACPGQRGYSFAFSRRTASELCLETSRPLKSGAQGMTGCALHPRSHVRFAQNRVHTSIQVQRRTPGLPCAMALRLISRSPW